MQESRQNKPLSNQLLDRPRRESLSDLADIQEEDERHIEQESDSDNSSLDISSDEDVGKDPSSGN